MLKKTATILLIFPVLLFAGCTKKDYSKPENYECPNKKSIDCMPSVSKENAPFCESNFREWMESNCDINFTD